MLEQKYLKILICPKCKGELEYAVDEHNHHNGKLLCKNCHLAYPVENDLPKLLIDEAKALDEIPGS